MKIFTLSLLLVFTGLITRAQQDTLANPGFELWTPEFNGSSGTHYFDPVSWTTANSLTSILSIITVAPDSTVAHSGKYSAKIYTQHSSAEGYIPGALTTGQFDVANQTIIGGIPIASRPTALNGWYRYAGVNGDTGGISINLFSGSTLVGSGSFYPTGTDTTWTSFSVAITYSSGTTPDTSQIVFTSSASNSPQTNSTLWIDDVSYNYTSAINETSFTPVKIYPNPAVNTVALDNHDMQAKIANLYTMDGRLANSYVLNADINQLNISSLPAGIYVIAATGNNGSQYRSKLVVE